MQQYCNENGLIYSISTTDPEQLSDKIYMVRAEVELFKEGEIVRRFSRVGTNAERPKSNSKVRKISEHAIEFAETRAIKRCIKCLVGGSEEGE